MACDRDTYTAEWDSWADAISAWESCGCYVCADALEELPAEYYTDPKQTTLN